jgi:hypothetical protein
MAAISKGPGNKSGLNQFTFSLETPSLSSGTLDKYLKSVLGEDSAHTIPDLLKPIQSSGDVRQTDDGSSLDDKHSPVSTIPINQQSNVSSAHAMMGVSQNLQNTPQVTANIVHQNSVGQDLALQGQDASHNGQQLATTNDSNELIPVPRGQNYVDITEYLNMPQADAAKKLGIPPSTLSKRWKEAVRKRKWPYRMICKIDKEIMTLLHNVPQGPNAPPLPEEIETALGISLRKRQEELRPVVIRI